MSETSNNETDEASEQQDAGWWQRIRSHRLARWAIDLTIIALVFAAVSAWQTRDLVDSGEPAPPTALRNLDGEVVDFEQYKGKKTMVVFWAPWCGVCGAESDNVDRVKSLLGDRINVTSVVLDYRGRDDIQEFIDEHDVQYPVLLGEKHTAEKFRVSVFPTLYILDADGHIEHTVAGYTTTLGMLWRVVV
jgi:peroxiredoxin